MTPDIADHWVILRMRYSPQALWVHYEDYTGVTRVPPMVPGSQNWLPRPLPQFNLTGGVVVPGDLDALLRSALAALATISPVPHRLKVPLPIFFEAPPGHNASQDWQQIIAGLLPLGLNHDLVQLIQLSGDKSPVKQTPLTLPLRILTISPCDSILNTLKLSSWYQNNQAVRTNGLSIETTWPSELPLKLKSEQRDVVLADQNSIAPLLAEIEKLTLNSNRRPRLVIFFGEPDSEPYVLSLQLPKNIAFLWLPVTGSMSYTDPGMQAFAKEFFYNIIHDYPLHEALRVTSRKYGTALARPPLLIANQNSNNSVRISQAMEQLQIQLKSIQSWNRLGNLHKFIARAGSSLSEPLRIQLLGLDHSRSRIKSATAEVNNLTPSFEKETKGLVPLVEMAGHVEVAQQASASIAAAAAAIASDPALSDSIKQLQERRVDVTLQQVESDPPYQSVDQLKPLRPLETYQVTVFIGHPSAESLMLAPPPPIDPLLPETEKDGYELEVAFFEKDFELLSDGLQPLYLPKLGGSKSVYFEIRAPEKSGPAEARIGVYFQNNLLQSFLLRANVAAIPQADPKPVTLKLYVASAGERADQYKWVEKETNKQVFVHLAFSQTARFGNLEQMEPRVMSIGINQDANGASHTFMLKSDGKRQGIVVDGALLKQQNDAFRDILKANVRDANDDPVFETYPQPGDKVSNRFMNVTRDLIKAGVGLRDVLFNRAGRKMLDALRALAAGSDKTIQLIRHDPGAVFPWPILYDFPLPKLNHGDAEPPVCLGLENRDTATGEYLPAKQCKHGPRDGGYCIYGFWGIRHEVEQLLELSDDVKDTVTDITPTSKPFVRLATSADDTYTQDLKTSLTKTMDTAFTDDPGADLINLLWDDQQRPGILIVLGHMAELDAAGEPKGSRMLLPENKWFLANEVSNRLLSDPPWNQPNTLVLLMGCSSAATELTTLNNFVTSLRTAGATAVIGTECLVFSSLVARFTREVTSDLWNQKRLGEAMKFFNRRLVSDGNPLAFVFNCLGSTSIKLVRNA
jgi:hypothetical protein